MLVRRTSDTYRGHCENATWSVLVTDADSLDLGYIQR